MAGIEDGFPGGLRVLVVDDNLTCLRILELLLHRCKYKVTGTQEATEALKMLMENPKKFDIVISDVHMPVMDGFQLLENIGLHMDIPVIMLSANDDYAQVMRGIKHGAVDFLIKPVRTKELKNIWQHVVRRKCQDKTKGKTVVDEKEEAQADQSKDGKRSTSQEPDPKTKNRNDNDDDRGDEDGPKINNHGPSSSKRQRVVWSPNLHKKFVNAVNQLGPKEALPKKILDVMNVEGLTRENVASHLQKYRLYLKRMTYTMAMGQPVYPTLTPFEAHDSSLFRPGGPMFNPYAPFTNSSMGLTLSFPPITTNGRALERMITPISNPRGYIAQISGANQCQMNSNQVTTSRPSIQGIEGLPNQPSLPTQYSGYRPQYGIPNLQYHTKCTKNWQNNNVTRATIPPEANFNGGVCSTKNSHLQNALGTPSSQYPFHPVVQSRRFGTGGIQECGGDSTSLPNTSNDGDQPIQRYGESSSNPYGKSVGPTYGHVERINTSSDLQNIEAQERELDALLDMDESHLLDDLDLFAGLHENDNNSFRDILD